MGWILINFDSCNFFEKWHWYEFEVSIISIKFLNNIDIWYSFKSLRNDALCHLWVWIGLVVLRKKNIKVYQSIYMYMCNFAISLLSPSKRVLTCLCLAYRLINSMMLWVKIEIWNGLSGSWSGNLTYCFLKLGFLKNKIRRWIFHYFAFIFPWRRMWTFISNELFLIQIWLKLVQYIILKCEKVYRLTKKYRDTRRSENNCSGLLVQIN